MTSWRLLPERPDSRRPLLLLDVDGVLVVLGDAGGEPVFEARAGIFSVRIAERTPQHVRALAKEFDVAYASSWGTGADDFISPLIGLPHGIPHIPFDRDAEVPIGTTWKLPAVARFVRSRPAAWVDDEIDGDVDRWAASRAAPTLVVCTDPSAGLLDTHVTELLHFAGSVTCP
ncbi:MAG TPA: hypothetical protein PKB03_06960 [Baekduia sp.]|nr:hypothetical protein [Baekduia sp.]